MLHVCAEANAMHELARPLPRLSNENAIIVENTKKSTKKFYDAIQEWCRLDVGELEYERAFNQILEKKRELDTSLGLCRDSKLLREEEERVIESLERCAKTACSIHNIETGEYSDKDKYALENWGEMFFSKKLVDVLAKRSAPVQKKVWESE
jgi:hypothetical protein